MAAEKRVGHLLEMLSDLCKTLKQGRLGFLEFRNFNLAMLAKQGWRLVTNPHSLMGLVLQARYYPKGEFFTTDLGS